VLGCHSQERCASATRANSKQARVLGLLRRPRGATIATNHGNHRLAVALGAGVLCRRVRKKLGLKLASEKTDGGRIYRIAGGKPEAIKPDDTSAAQPSA
jgi:hypothetical protein